MARSSYIGVDLGGTSIRAARFSAGSERPQRKTKIPTRADQGLQAVMERLEQAIREIAPGSLDDVAGIGITAPGPLDPYAGIVLSAPNLPGWRDIPLRQIMEERLGLPVFIGNDANLATLGEWKFGAGRGHADVLYLTISTGIGGGVISGGRLLLGARGLAAEVGHILAVPDGPLCSCGQRGHLEAVASGTAIGREARARLQAEGHTRSRLLELAGGDSNNITGLVVGAAAQAGDELAIRLIVEAGTLIGRTVASLLHAYNPSIVICGGGVSMIGDLLLDPIRVAIRTYAMSEGYWRDCPVVRGELGDDSGLIGAAALAMDASTGRA